MVVPPVDVGTKTSGGSTLRDIRASAQNGIVGSVSTGLGDALLVYQPPSSGSGGGVGGTSFGAQVLTAVANAQKIALGSMIVGEGSALTGAVANTSGTGGILLISDGNNNIIARVPMPNNGDPAVFNPALYPKLAALGALADQKNNALGNYTSLGQTPIGMQWASSNPSTSTPTLLGWTTGEQDSIAHNWSINPANFPFTLWQVYIGATDELAALLFGVSAGTGPSSKGTNQKILLFDPNGQPHTNITASANYVDYSGQGGSFHVVMCEDDIIPGWWSLVDNGQGNDTLNTYYYGFEPYSRTPVIGGGTAAGWQVMGGTVSNGQTNPYPGQYNDVSTGSPVWKSPTTGIWYYGSGFNYTSRFQYQAADTLYRQNVTSVSFTALFNAVPTTGAVTVSGLA